MKDPKAKSRIPILAAGGIVLRNGALPRFAVVQSRKIDAWGLPKGKLAAGEDAMTAARREVLEETGYRVTIHEFLGMLAYQANSRPKVVQFWRMETVGRPVGDLMGDVRAVRWLALEEAINQLTHLREQVFLQQVGPIALQFAELGRSSSSQRPGAGKAIVPSVPLAPTGDVFLPDQAAEDVMAGSTEKQQQDFTASVLSGLCEQRAPVEGTENVEKAPEGTVVKKTLVKKTWGWFRHAALLHRQFD